MGALVLGVMHCCLLILTFRISATFAPSCGRLLGRGQGGVVAATAFKRELSTAHSRYHTCGLLPKAAESHPTAMAASDTSAGASPMWESVWNAKGLKPGEKFDTGAPGVCLLFALETGKFKAGKVLVPGGGRGYDAFALAKVGANREVWTLDLSATASVRAQEWLSVQGDQEAVKNVHVVTGDFFQMAELTPASFDAIWDCTFLCALDPSVRSDWARRQAELLKPDGQLWTLIYPMFTKEAPQNPTMMDAEERDLHAAPGGGPPYCLSFKLVESLLVPLGFSAVHRFNTHEHGLPLHATAAAGAGTARNEVVCWVRNGAAA